jgi:SAM-dependent methyltransferase
MPYPDHEINRHAWNNMVDLHIDHPEYRTKEVIEGGSSLKKIELQALGDVKGKSLLHLMCQFGLDSLSWVRKVAIVTGVDISDRSIERANELKRKAGLKAEVIRCDVLDFIGRVDGKFDIVFQSYGTHIWISDIFRWAEVIAYYLKPGGTFFIVDEHPISPLFLYPPSDYFATAPDRETNPVDYCERDHHIDGELIEWQHPLSKMLTGLIEAGLVIEEVQEYNHGYYRVEKDWYRNADHYWYPPGGPTPYPLLMSIKARRPR